MVLWVSKGDREQTTTTTTKKPNGAEYIIQKYS